MFGPEGRPQHCCAWLGVASSFPECASPIVPEEVKSFSPPALNVSFMFIFLITLKPEIVDRVYCAYIYQS